MNWYYFFANELASYKKNMYGHNHKYVRFKIKHDTSINSTILMMSKKERNKERIKTQSSFEYFLCTHSLEEGRLVC